MTTLSTLAGNVSTVGNTQTLTNKDLTAASNTFPATGTQGFVASGAISTGDTVVLNSDGTVSVVVGVAQAVGTAVVFESANSFYIASTFDSANNKVVIAYTDNGNSNYGTAVVGTVSGTSISFGTPVVFESATSIWMSATYDANAQKVVIAYRDGGNSFYGTAIVGTVSGTSISFGTAVVFESANSQYISATFDSNSNKVVIAYQDYGNSQYGTAIVGTVSGTSISFGTAVVFESAESAYISAVYDANAQKVVIAYRDDGNSNYGTAVVGTVSGTSISFGTLVVFNSSTTDYVGIAYDANAQKTVISYQDGGNSNYGTAIVGTVSGTSISFGTEIIFESSQSSYVSISYSTVAKKVVISYQDGGNSDYGTAIVGAVSGTSISFGTPVVFESAGSNWISSVYDANAQKVVIAYQDSGNSSYGTAIVFQNESTNAPDFVGLATQTVTDTDPVDVTIIGGTNEDITGLTAASLYYVADNGDLTTIVTDTYAGRALASTKLLVRG